ncbi:MAG: SNF2 helicase associated domain-containing protein [Clostridia bacterium]|nr:SNF2 helicase associated domain-containing protein [Clostridia bacterium]MDD4386479.1 SNF2 helicase associated domain-containing protein [Clostridia bacterium]
MIVSENVLNNLYSNIDPIRLEKAKGYVELGRVNIYRIRFIDSENFILNSRVTGHSRVYDVEVEVRDGYVVSEVCGCLHFNSNDNLCKHIAASVIEFVTNPKYSKQMLIGGNEIQSQNRIKEQKIKKYGTSYKVISEFNSVEKDYSNTHITNDSVKNGAIRIVPLLKHQRIDGKLSISFQIGMKQLYKLKDLPAFFDSISSGNKLKYGVNLEFNHNIEKFDESSKKIIPFILKYGEIIKYANDNSSRYNSYYGPSIRALSISEIKLNGESFDDLFDLFIGQTINVGDYYEKSGYTFEDKEPDIKFDIEKIDDEDYRLINNFIDSYDIINGKKYLYIISNHKIYRCSNEFEKNTLKLLNIFKNNANKEIVFNKEDLPAFFSLVVPKVKKNIDSRKLDPAEVEKYIPKDLNVKIFLDFNEHDNVLANVKFCYAEYEFNPFDINEQVDVIRNIAQEDEVKLIFKNTGFKIDEEKYNMSLINNDNIYNFLFEDINKYMEKFDIMVTDNFKSKQIRQPKIGTLGVKVENNLLQINLENLDFDKSELKNIMKMYSIKKKYHRLKDGSFLKLQDNEDIEFLNLLTEGMDIDYKSLANGTVRVPIYRSIYLEKLLDSVKNTTIVKNDEYKKIINKIEDKEDNENIVIPKSFDKILRSYQKTGYKWLKVLDEYKFGGVLADDMGLGKTLQLIAIISSYITDTKKAERKTSLVVCPSSLCINWKNEVKKFSSNIKVLVISGKASERKDKIKMLEKYDLIITSYDLLKRDIDVYTDLKYVFKYVIADEAQYIKNSNTKNATALKSINASTRFALTGTPIENSLAELWSIFDYIMPGYLFSYSKFKKNYEIPIVRDNNADAMKKFKMLIEPFVLRRLKKDVLTELPDKTISLLNNEMSEEQNKIYLSYLMNAKKEMQTEINTNGFEKSQIKILALLMRLRQICCHPSLFIENYKGDSSKLNQCIEIIKDALQSDHKILLFSQFTSMFEIIEKELNKEKIKYFKLTGGTKVEERIQLVDEFNMNKDIKVFLISLKAGGIGLNLTGADMVIHYDPWWNLSAENQATDRTYRIGQKNNVQVYKLITQNSIEEKINELQEKKAKLTDSVLSTEETFINKLSKQDIMSLFE